MLDKDLTLAALGLNLPDPEKAHRRRGRWMRPSSFPHYFRSIPLKRQNAFQSFYPARGEIQNHYGRNRPRQPGLHRATKAIGRNLLPPVLRTTQWPDVSKDLHRRSPVLKEPSVYQRILRTDLPSSNMDRLSDRQGIPRPFPGYRPLQCIFLRNREDRNLRCHLPSVILLKG